MQTASRDKTHKLKLDNERLGRKPALVNAKLRGGIRPQAQPFRVGKNKSRFTLRLDQATDDWSKAPAHLPFSLLLLLLMLWLPQGKPAMTLLCTSLR